MNYSFFRELLETIVERGRTLPGMAGVDDSETLEDLSRDLLTRRGESSGMAIAQAILTRVDRLDDEGLLRYFRFLAEAFKRDEALVADAARAYLAAPGPETFYPLVSTVESPRQEYFRRLNLAPGATAALVGMRAKLLPLLAEHDELHPVDRDLKHLFNAWFNRGFLVMARLDWQSRANILEKIIEYEAVHQIRGWDDLKRRLDPRDRRCFGFFHPSLVDEPLIFVEVALTQDIPASIDDLLAEEPRALDQSADTAVFYSISNCQKGLAGISFGSFLIKQVVTDLKLENPALKTFVTLSPLPGLRDWLAAAVASGSDLVKDEERASLSALLEQPDWSPEGETAQAARPAVMRLAAHYLVEHKTVDGKPADPVARFHLGNGARLERVNWAGDLSGRGRRQSLGVMVNYLYDLRYIERNHEAFAEQGSVVHASGVKRLL